MNNRQKNFLKKQLLNSNLDFNQKLGEFIKIFNSDFFDPDFQSEKWNISNDEWQRYEFLGDRVLNLVAADYLYHQTPSNREGEMTKMMGVVSNESLTGIIDRNGIDVARLIPETIGQQQTYGERVKGGAFEAFIGALYEIVGFEGTARLSSIFCQRRLSSTILQPIISGVSRKGTSSVGYRSRYMLR
jgi:dsRNA-specific ribonuclease